MARTASRLKGFALPSRCAANRDRTVACAARDFERRTRARRVTRAAVLPTLEPFVVHAIVRPSHHAQARHQCAGEKRSG
jgi:hypothetical protein